MSKIEEYLDAFDQNNRARRVIIEDEREYWTARADLPFTDRQGNRLVKGDRGNTKFRTGKYESFGIGYGADSYWGLAILDTRKLSHL